MPRVEEHGPRLLQLDKFEQNYRLANEKNRKLQSTSLGSLLNKIPKEEFGIFCNFAKTY